jgi:PTH1 family peptidyl-tRNA hydrolase
MFIKVFVGIGNPGGEYKNTRHNFGFEVIDAIAESKNLSFKNYENTAGISLYEHENGKSYLLKPLTFMNNSGYPLASFMNYYKIIPQEIFVFYDDFAIPLGSFKIRMNGSAGGHKGIESIINSIKSQDFARMKLGIGPQPQNMQNKNFVLSSFRKDEQEKVENVKKKALDIFEAICEMGLEKAVSRIQSS